MNLSGVKMEKKKRSQSRGSRSSSGRSKSERTPAAQPTEPTQQSTGGGGGCCGGGSAPADVAPSPERSGAPDGWKAGSSEEEQTSPAAAAPGGDDSAVGADKVNDTAEASLPAASPPADGAASGSGGSNPPEQQDSKPAKPPSKKETFGTFVGSFQPATSLVPDGKGGAMERAATQDDLSALVEMSAEAAVEEEHERRRRRSSAAKHAPRPAMGDAEAALAAAEGDEAVSRALEKVGVQPISRERRSSATIANSSPMLSNTPLGRRLQAQAEEQARRDSLHTAEQ